MELYNLFVLMLFCAMAEPIKVREKVFRRSVEQPSTTSPTGSLLKPGFKIITELPQPAPGFFLNRQFQKKKAGDFKETPAESPSAPQISTPQGTFKIAVEAKPEAGFFLNRQFQLNPSTEQTSRNDMGKARKVVVDSTGRQWVVAEPVQPEPGFFLNRQFQNKNGVKTSLSSNAENTNDVFLLRENSAPLVKDPAPLDTIFQQAPGGLAFHAANSEQQQQTTPHSNLFTILAPRIAANPTAQTPHAAPISNPVLSSQNHEAQLATNAPSSSRTSVPPSFIVRQLLNNQNKERSDAKVTEKKVITVIAHQPQRPTFSSPRDQTSQTTEFNCDGKPYGYYADIKSNCQQYHVCNPVNFGSGFVQYYKYSFTCTAGLLWDSVHKVCVPAGTASPCQ